MSVILAWGGAVLAALALMHPGLGLFGVLGLFLTLPALRRQALPFALALVYVVAAECRREFRADSLSYFAYLRSAFFDRDLDFTNEWSEFGYPEASVTATGHRTNTQSAGPAILWAPFYVVAHAVVKVDGVLRGRASYLADGYSAPYVGAAAVSTLTLAVLGSAALVQVLARSLGLVTALLAVAGTVLVSPVLYYLFVVPTMAHGVTYGVAALVVWSWDRARREPSLRSWLLLGALCGLLTLCRWQAAVYAILLGMLAARGKARVAWIASAAAVAFFIFLPQLWAWKVLFGRFLVLPQGTAYLTWTSPHLFQTLFSANHGLFTWTPALFIGLLGLFAGLRRDPLLHAGALAVILATAWVNGSVTASDVDAGDAFGARRFDLTVPLFAVGMGTALALSSRVLRRAPLLAPASALVLLAFWNVGFIQLFRARMYPEMAPFDAVARGQAEQLHRGVKGAAGRVFGDAGRAWVYRFFSAEYFYTIFNRSGTIDLWQADERYLLGGWGSRSRRIARPPFRRALYPEACVRVPLEEPFDLRVEVEARLPPELSQQEMTLAANGAVVGAATLSAEWGNSFFFVPGDRLKGGENSLCLRFGIAPPGGLEEPVAAEVTRIQLP